MAVVSSGMEMVLGASGTVGWDIELGNSEFKNSRGEGELREGNMKVS